MGKVWQMNASDLVHDYPAETCGIEDALVDVTKAPVDVTLGQLSGADAKRALLDLDVIASQYQDEAMAAAFAEAAPAVISLIRWINYKTAGGYGGIKGIGRALDMVMLRPVHVGDQYLTNDANSATKGLYAGTNASVYTWYSIFTAGTAANVFPSQVMPENAGIVIVGVADSVEVPPIGGVKFTLSGVATTVQSVDLVAATRGSPSDFSFAKLKMPVMFGPKRTVRADYYPHISAGGRTQLVGVLVATAEKLTA